MINKSGADSYTTGNGIVQILQLSSGTCFLGKDSEKFDDLKIENMMHYCSIFANRKKATKAPKGPQFSTIGFSVYPGQLISWEQRFRR